MLLLTLLSAVATWTSFCSCFTHAEDSSSSPSGEAARREPSLSSLYLYLHFPPTCGTQSKNEFSDGLSLQFVLPCGVAVLDKYRCACLLPLIQNRKSGPARCRGPDRWNCSLLMDQQRRRGEHTAAPALARLAVPRWKLLCLLQPAALPPTHSFTVSHPWEINNL